jgi:hypothetical protein
LKLGSGVVFERGGDVAAIEDRRPVARTTETKAAYKTTELVAYVATVVGVLIASAVVDDPGVKNIAGFDAKSAWFYVTLLTIGYMLSRGLAKSGSREPYLGEPRREAASSRAATAEPWEPPPP